MALPEGAVRNADVGGAEQAAARREAEQVKLGFEKPDWYLQKRSFNIRIRAETVKYFLRDAQYERILDIGCGDGSISVPLLTANHRLTLVDLSQTMLSIARARVPAELASRVNTINDLFTHASLDPGSYDLIICLGVLAYVHEARGFLEKIRSLLRPQGHVIIEWTDSSHPVSALGRTLGAVRSLLTPAKVPLVLHSSAEVTGLLSQLGFNLRGAFRYSLPPPGIRKVVSQRWQYKSVRALFGSAARNRIPWLGSECVCHFQRQD